MPSRQAIEADDPDFGRTTFLQKETDLKRLLLATDLSSRADRALERSIDLARRHMAHLTVLHVVDEDLPIAIGRQLVEAAEAEIDAALKKVSLARELDIAVSVIRGRDHRTILETAEKDRCDLIILGRHRDESMDRPLRGTTMERVLCQGQIPVLVVTGRVDGNYQKVMIGVDFSLFSRFAVKAGFAIAPRADFHFVHAVQVPFEGFLSGNVVRREMSREREDALSRIIDEEMEILIRTRAASGNTQGKLHRVVRDGEVLSVLRSEAARISPDLMVIGTHGRVGIAHALLGSVAENLLNHPPCDVLAVKAW